MNEEMEVKIDFDKLPESIVKSNHKGYRDFETDQLPEIRQWIYDMVPSSATKLTVVGRFPSWIGMWIGIVIAEYNCEIRYRHKNTPSIVLREGI